MYAITSSHRLDSCRAEVIFVSMVFAATVEERDHGTRKLVDNPLMMEDWKSSG